jgi:RHH-type proline utilization regulon transcriptional repressor/proline dehydrogenase/delta 1-pyrroline-5-carboxylate dehydrogenase
MTELLPRVLQLAELARQYDIGMNIDAEEADRLEISLDLLEALCLAPSLAGWNGLGFVIQAYQKRCPFVIDYVVDLARRTGRRLMVRLVKGAYWDSEIKRAQIDGLTDYPVYTRKVHTDVSYLACARKLLAAPDAIYPQFATHNAQTLASIYQMAGPPATSAASTSSSACTAWASAVRTGGGPAGRPCRIYAPVGTHETLLAYLVRRLLENGANSSFVHRIADPCCPCTNWRFPRHRRGPVHHPRRQRGRTPPAHSLPGQLYGPQRANSQGLDLSSDTVLPELQAAWSRHWAPAGMPSRCWPCLPTQRRPPPARGRAQSRRPQRPAGDSARCHAGGVEQALQAAHAGAADWARTPPPSVPACCRPRRRL